MRNIRLTIEYEGTNYHGWQSQENAVAIQDVVEKAIKKLTGEECKITGCSRTDMGVHALGQVANFYTDSRIPPDKFPYALNGLLPEDITVVKSEEVEKDFHARYRSKGKKYRYLIYNDAFPSALLRNRAWHVYQQLDMDAMVRASQYFLGKHDFSAFKAAGSSTKTSERTIYTVSLEKKEKLIQFEISGDGFLYNMVRIITGTLVCVGMGKIPRDNIPLILQSSDRRLAGKTAPAHGLYLIEVYY